jgi:hypothetical protein
MSNLILHKIQPTNIEEAFRFGKMVVAGNLAPYGMNESSIAVAIIQGMEIGLSPMNALQNIVVIKGRTTISAKGARGLVMGSGLVEDFKEEMRGEGDDYGCFMEVKRKGISKPFKSSFTIKDAKRAGLWQDSARVKKFKKDGSSYESDNDSAWYRHPDRMLKARASGFIFSDGFSDVLGGMYLREEFDDGNSVDMVDVTPQSNHSKMFGESPMPPQSPFKKDVIEEKPADHFSPEVDAFRREKAESMKEPDMVIDSPPVQDSFEVFDEKSPLFEKMVRELKKRNTIENLDNLLQFDGFINDYDKLSKAAQGTFNLNAIKRREELVAQDG